MIGIRCRDLPRAHGDDLLVIGHVDPLDCYLNAEHLGLERHGEVLLEHSVKAGSLLRLPVSVHSRFLDELVELRGGELLAMRRLLVPHWFCLARHDSSLISSAACASASYGGRSRPPAIFPRA